ncbi:MAG TPA: isoprenylcysteine carboxylmethyltransferase family protein [Bryobacteraceae bacterium]|jgi:protein-S-isoprenylcysteine O-methyltransferase Ste14
MGGLQLLIFATFVALWVAWFMPFVITRRGGGAKADVRAPASRWGMLLQGISFGFASFHYAGWNTFTTGRVIASLIFEVIAVLLAWTSVHALGKQWRLEAALSIDHELIQSGPYSVIRHPIYTSMFCIFIALALMLGYWSTAVVGAVIFVIGTEIRVRAEERLLAGRFGPNFDAYRKRVPAYIPGVR